ncbi:MAG TPA: TetR/AcrR family transcriptional regulator [Magnetovibrio sp.]
MRSGDATRERIKHSALTLFVRSGVDGTGVREIAKASNITEGAIYRHFAGKDELVWTLFADNFVDYAEKLDELQRGEHGTANKLAAIVHSFCALFDADEKLFRFLMLVQHGQLAKVTPDMKTPFQVLQAVICEGIEAGDVGYTDATAATAAVIGIVLQTATFKIDGRLDDTMTSRAGLLATACQNAIAVKA